MKKSIIWLRRNLRLEDNFVIKYALENSDMVAFAFVFDENILKHFPNPDDRRLSFIARSLEYINSKLLTHSSSIHILYGDPTVEIPILAKKLGANFVFADEDFEPDSIDRDEGVKNKLRSIGIDLKLTLDHLLIHPKLLIKEDGMAYKVFTPFMKFFKSKLSEELYREVNYDLSGKIIENAAPDSPENILKKAGYNYRIDDLWKPENAKNQLVSFIKNKLANYKVGRNFLFGETTSRISPYLRFGSISIRECFRAALQMDKEESWLNELIWREFYAYILYHFPRSTEFEFQEKYVGKISWSTDENLYNKFINSETGFPIIDAAINELKQTGWMHNRARMIVASFFTKNLGLDWRLGEKFFAEYLMDYDLASNVGGWQWAASTGTDAQPYFRIFNPMNQARDYDTEGKYIKKYLPQLEFVNLDHISDGHAIYENYRVSYPRPVVDYKETRIRAIEKFSNIK